MDTLAQARVRIEELEKQVTALNRVASMGVVAAGVAHEINNALSCVVPNIEFADEQLGHLECASPEDLARVIAAMDEALEGARRMKRIAHDVKMFCSVPEENPRAHDLRGLVEVAARMVGSEVRRHGRLVLELEDTASVVVDEGRFVQVLVNLLLNAAQAIAAKRECDQASVGEVVVRTGKSSPAKAFVEIRDTGAGIPEDIRPKIFEPFFTTKPAGVGTGLGLSISKELVTGFGGDIEVDSEPGRGSTFRIVLPVNGR